jgi:alcohol dehydrogenase (cytochrome c)/quinohemoprotein ethanol dehydrogenase
MISFLSAALVAAAGLAACVNMQGGAGSSATDPADLPQNAGQWLSYGRDYSEQRFSPLTQVNVSTVSQLGLAWYGDLSERGGSYETTPLIVDGRIYVTSPWSKVYAYDAKTGKKLWKYDPHVPGEYAVKLCCGIVNRGVGFSKGKIIWGTLDGRLIAVDARTGSKVWEIQATDPKKWLSITGAPRIADGHIFIGEAGSEFEERGYLACYNADNGKELWRWWSVPGDPSKGFEQPELAMAAKTWGGEWWKTGGGGTPWDGITYDPTTGYVFIGTGNGAPWPAEDRSPGSGDNLFTASIVAIDAKTGHYVWHYQETPAESFDFDSTAQITTADLVINGEKRHVVMHAPKNGIFYVLDAHTGKFISGTPFVPKVNWMTGFDADGRPMLNPQANYAKTGKGFYLVGFQSHVWNPMSFNPQTGLVYLPTNYGSYPYVSELGAKMGNQLLGINIRKRPEGTAPVLEGPRSYLVAWDPVKRKEAWRQTEGTSRAGTMTTAGNLVFQGNAQHNFNAYRADTGEKVWSADTQAGITGGPATYAIDGQQYVAVVAAGQSGFGGGGYWAPNYARLLVYKLGGNAQLPEKVAFTPPTLNPPANFGDAAQHEEGEKQYTAHCAGCHGNNAPGGRQVSSLFPDLRYAGALWSADAFKAIVIDGALQENGMVSFAKVITPQDAEAIRSYMVTVSNDAKNAPPPPPGPGGPGGRGGPGGPPAAAPAPTPAPAPALHQ